MYPDRCVVVCVVAVDRILESVVEKAVAVVTEENSVSRKGVDDVFNELVGVEFDGESIVVFDEGVVAAGMWTSRMRDKITKLSW